MTVVSLINSSNNDLTRHPARVPAARFAIGLLIDFTSVEEGFISETPTRERCAAAFKTHPLNIDKNSGCLLKYRKKNSLIFQVFLFKISDKENILKIFCVMRLSKINFLTVHIFFCNVFHSYERKI